MIGNEQENFCAPANTLRTGQASNCQLLMWLSAETGVLTSHYPTESNVVSHHPVMPVFCSNMDETGECQSPGRAGSELLALKDNPNRKTCARFRSLDRHKAKEMEREWMDYPCPPDSAFQKCLGTTRISSSSPPSSGVLLSNACSSVVSSLIFFESRCRLNTPLRHW